MLAGAGANLSVDRRSRRNRREFRVTRATCVSRSSRVSTPHLRSLRRGLANQPGLLRSVLRPDHWYAHSLFEAVLGARRSRCPYLRDSARFPIALRSTRRTPTPSRYTSRAHSHNGARRRPRDSTSRVRVPASSACGNGSPRSFGSCGTRPRSCPRRARGRCRREQTGAISPVGLPALLLSSPSSRVALPRAPETAVDLRVVLTGPGHGGAAAPELPPSLPTSLRHQQPLEFL